MGNNTVGITIQGQALFDQIHSEFAKLGAKVDSFATKVKQSKAAPTELGAAFAALGGKVTAMFASFVAIGTLKHFSDEAMRSARQMAQLEAALTSTGKASEEFRRQLAAEREELSKKIGVDDDAVVSVQRQLVQYGVAKDQIKELTELTFDLAAAQGIDATTAAMEMGRALAGQDVQMRGVRLEIDRTLPKIDQVSQMMERLNQKFGGQAKAAFEASAPELTRFKTQLGETAKAIGENINQWSELLKPMTKALEVIEKINKAAVGDKVAPSGAVNSTAAGMIKPISQEAMRNFAGQGDELFNRRLKMLAEHQATDLAGARVPLAGAETDRDLTVLEGQFQRGQVKLRDYLFRRQQIIKESMVAEQQFITTTAAMLTNEIALKQAEVKQLTVEAEGDPAKQEDLIRSKTELAKLELDLAKTQASQGALNARGGTLDEQNKQFSQQHPTTAGGALSLVSTDFSKEWADGWVNAAHTVETEVNNAISSISAGMVGLIKGTTTWGEVLVNIGTHVLQTVIESLFKMFAAWVIGRLAVSATEKVAGASDAASKAPAALATSIESYGAAAVVGAAAYMAAMAMTAAFAEGGRPEVGEVALVGERGAELFVPDTAGTIVPAHVTSQILNGAGGSRSQRESRRNSEQPIIHINNFGDNRAAMAKFMNSTEGQHHIVNTVGNNQHRISPNR